MQFPLDLNENNVRRLALGHPIQLKAGALKGSQHFVIVHPTVHSRMSKAARLGKGARLSMTPAEIQQTAEAQGFGDLWNKIKSGAKWVKQNIIDQPVYQSVVRPIAKKAVASAVAPVIAALPEVLQAPAQAAVQKASEVTGAFGLEVMPKTTKKRAGITKGLSKPRAKKASKGLQSNPKKTVGGSFLLS